MCIRDRDQTVQSMPDVSPTKWHRAHTTWFYETFLLAPSVRDYRPFHPAYGYLFNSYYEGVGARYPRHDRGLISRPGIHEIAEYRAHVDAAMDTVLEHPGDGPAAWLVELGIQHEQQHQELLLMDIKHVLSRNPCLPAYDVVDMPRPSASHDPTWTEHPGGTYDVGHNGQGFSFDNELPRHPEYLGPFSLADQPVTCGQWLGFIEDQGYRRPELWLSDGWATVMAEGWEAPLYWSKDDDRWYEFTLGGPIAVNPAQPVCHVSYYEADAYARWAGCRLPTEAEWEVAAQNRPVDGHFLDQSRLHPCLLYTSPGHLVGQTRRWVIGGDRAARPPTRAEDPPQPPVRALERLRILGAARRPAGRGRCRSLPGRARAAGAGTGHDHPAHCRCHFDLRRGGAGPASDRPGVANVDRQRGGPLPAGQHRPGHVLHPWRARPHRARIQPLGGLCPSRAVHRGDPGVGLLGPRAPRRLSAGMLFGMRRTAPIIMPFLPSANRARMRGGSGSSATLPGLSLIHI